MVHLQQDTKHLVEEDAVSLPETGQERLYVAVLAGPFLVGKERIMRGGHGDAGTSTLVQILTSRLSKGHEINRLVDTKEGFTEPLLDLQHEIEGGLHAKDAVPNPPAEVASLDQGLITPLARDGRETHRNLPKIRGQEPPAVIRSSCLEASSNPGVQPNNPYTRYSPGVDRGDSLSFSLDASLKVERVILVLQYEPSTEMTCYTMSTFGSNFTDFNKSKQGFKQFGKRASTDREGDARAELYHWLLKVFRDADANMDALVSRASFSGLIDVATSMCGDILFVSEM